MTNCVIAAGVGTPLDYTIIVAYFLVVLGFGTYFARYTKSTKDFFYGGQRFSWWLIAFSLVASAVGSYSFIKYSDTGFRYGMSSSMTYLNDWFFVPLFLFGWLPIIYFARVRSIPEYFGRRFDTRARLMSVVLLLLYMIGYVGYNLYTLGLAAEKILGVPLYPACVVIAIITGIYITSGGQTAVIFTDLLQGVMLLIAGAVVVFLGLSYLAQGEGAVASLKNYWSNMSLSARLPFADFNKPEDFNFVGVFWQDMANSFTFIFINQGLIMRYLAAKSMAEGRRTFLCSALILMPVSVIVVGGAGWMGHAIANMSPETLDPNTPGKDAFVVITALLCHKGVFGFVIACLIAALMSTVDTLINAIAAVSVVDVYQPYLAPNRSDRHYLFVARVVSVVVTAIAIGLVPIFASFDSIYEAHGMFTAAVTPPMVVALSLGVVWKRFTPAAAFWTMLVGIVAGAVSFKYPEMIEPVMRLHGMPEGSRASYMRALYLLAISGVVGVVVTRFTRPKPEEEIRGLWIGAIESGRRSFKNGTPNDRKGSKVLTMIEIVDRSSIKADPAYAQEWEGAAASSAETKASPIPEVKYPVVSLSQADMEILAADSGDLLYIADERRYLGGLRSLHVRAGQTHDQPGIIRMVRESAEEGNFRMDRRVRVEKIF